MAASASASMMRCGTWSAVKTVTEQLWHFKSQTSLQGVLLADRIFSLTNCVLYNGCYCVSLPAGVCLLML